MALGSAARCVLGNHDLHLLAVAHGIRATHSGDTLDAILKSPKRESLLAWLRAQPMARLESPFGKDLLLVHAGGLPAWSAEKTLALAGEVEAVLRSDGVHAYLQTMYGNVPACWSDDLQGADRLRVVVNALTRLRYCNAEGAMEFASKETRSSPGLPALVRGARARQRRNNDCFRPLGRTGLGREEQRVVPGRRVRLGSQFERAAHRWHRCQRRVHHQPL
jgi:bis(5'-nucleosyl)-tetraphosphatase (symmetrical)